MRRKAGGRADGAASTEEQPLVTDRVEPLWRKRDSWHPSQGQGSVAPRQHSRTAGFVKVALQHSRCQVSWRAPPTAHQQSQSFHREVRLVLLPFLSPAPERVEEAVRGSSSVNEFSWFLFRLERRPLAGLLITNRLAPNLLYGFKNEPVQITRHLVSLCKPRYFKSALHTSSSKPRKPCLLLPGARGLGGGPQDAQGLSRAASAVHICKRHLLWHSGCQALKTVSFINQPFHQNGLQCSSKLSFSPFSRHSHL